MLKEKIKSDLMSSMKAKDKLKTTTIRTLKSEIEKKQIELKKELTDSQIGEIVVKLVKQYNESLDFAKKNGRQDLIDENESILKILGIYLPKQMTEEEVKSYIQKVIYEQDFSSMKDKGSLMKIIMPTLKGKFDGQKINNIVTELLK